MARKAWTIIGLSGTTNSGKTTLASMLCESLPRTSSICQDTYFFAPDDPRVPLTENGEQNWDDLKAMDMNQMIKDVSKWIERHQNVTEKSYLIVEGFMIFNHRVLASLLDKKYFIKIDRETCALRRSKRTYTPPDYPGYFENIVWPMYLKNLEEIQDQTEIEYIDETKDLQKIHDYICQAVVTQ